MFSKDQIQIEDDLIVNKKRKLDKGSDELLEEDNCKILFSEFIVMSVIVNLLCNAFGCYMKLHHYKEAIKCVRYIIRLKPDYLKAY